MKPLKTHQRLSGIVIGVLTGVWLGWAINVGLINNNVTFPFSVWILTSIFAILIGLSAFLIPRTTEILIAGLIIGIVIWSGFWDFIVLDWSSTRTIITLSGLGILIMDVFLGSITIFDLIKIFRRIGGQKI